MKKHDLIIISSVLLYSYLFFEQTAGINFLLFTIVLTILLLVRDWTLLFNTSWILTAMGSFISAACIVYHNSTLSVIANILSLNLMASLSLNKGSSLILAAVYSIYSYLSVLLYMCFDFIERMKNKVNDQNNKSPLHILILLIPLLISGIFFLMYREANPLFKDFTKNINLNFLSLHWTLFTLGGLLLLYAFFNQRKIKYLFNKDLMASNTLTEEQSNKKNFLLKLMDVPSENLSGVVLLGLLNCLVVIVNILDINYIWISHNLPEGITFSEFVHQGVGMLITSIISAILIILYYFRGSQNFFNKNLTLKILAYLWIIQNVVLILSTAVRNQLYIQEFSLTYKRIGVYVYLILCLAGLATTLVKILRTRSNWFLFRKNGWVFYFVLIFSCLFNWDLIITRFNIQFSKNLDAYYLYSLSPSCLPDLWKLKNSSTAIHLDENILQQKIYDFENELEEVQWQSWNWENKRIKEELENLNKNQSLGLLHK